MQHILEKANLTPTQASILDYLYSHKQARASQIANKIKRSRAIVYRDLEELIDLKIVEKIDKLGEVSIFRANHPTHLEKMIDQKEEQIKKDRELFKSYLPDLVSSYNLINNKPGVKFYEGVDGIKYVLWDTLRTKGEIYTITDSQTVRKNMPLKKINEEYVIKRKELKIRKRIIAPLSAKEFYSNTKTDFTEIRFINEKDYSFCTAIQIYDNKISYQTITEENAIGVIIEDKNIHQMQKMIFENLWENAKI